MRIYGIVLALIVVSAWPALAAKPETLEQLKAKLETANPQQRVDLCLEIADRLLDNADQLYTAGKPDEGRAAVAELLSYTQKAADAATQSGKKLKPVEIAVRKMAHRLRDIKRTLNFEDQTPVQEAVDQLEHIRTDLLGKMFGLGKAKP
jgi:hypothetical protein